MVPGEFAKTRYGRLAPFYDALTALSGGGIARARDAFLGRLPAPPCNPLVVGCGPGAFPAAFVQAENPERLTINDLAPEMLERSQRRLAATGWTGTLAVLPGDITSLDLAPVYDLVVMQFVLTCFPQPARIRFLKRMRALLAPGGILLVADYSRPASPWLLPLFYLNYWASVLLLWPLAGNPPNLPGDIEQAILAGGFRILRKRSFTAGLYTAWLLEAR